MAIASENRVGWGLALRSVALCLLWFATQHVLMQYAAFALPRSLARQIPLETYLIGVQLLTLLAGGFFAWLLLKGQVRRELALRAPSVRATLLACFAAPVVFVAASYLAVYFALPTLLEEIRRGGVEAARQNTGQFGQALLKAPLSIALAWSVLVSPIVEEVLFRGSLWGAVQRLVSTVAPAKEPAAPSLPSQFIEPSLLLNTGRKLGGILRGGGMATLISSVTFGLMHWDMPGGQGIIRVTSTSCLGLACGIARHASGSVVIPICIHALFNALGLAGARRWIVSETFPTHYMVPTLATLLAALSVLAASTLLLMTRTGRRKT